MNYQNYMRAFKPMLQMGFKKSKITGAVDTSKVITGGRKWFGPGQTLKAFETIGQEISLDGTTVFAAADDLNVSFIYYVNVYWELLSNCSVCRCCQLSNLCCYNHKNKDLHIYKT